MDGKIDRWSDQWFEIQIDGWTDRKIELYTYDFKILKSFAKTKCNIS